MKIYVDEFAGIIEDADGEILADCSDQYGGVWVILNHILNDKELNQYHADFNPKTIFSLTGERRKLFLELAKKYPKRY